MAWDRRIDVIDMYIEDVAATRAFYEQAFGLPAQVHPGGLVYFTFGETMLHLRDVGSAAEFIAPARAAGSKEGSRGVFTIFTDDVDAACAELTDRGVHLLNGPADRWWGIRDACFADPSGQIWEIAGSASSAGASDAAGATGATGATSASGATGASVWQRTEKRIGNIVLFTEDWRRAKSFYQNGLGVPVDREYDDGASFRFDNMTVGVLDLPGARDLIKPAEVGGTATGLRFTFCTFVDDLDAACSELAERGVKPRADPWEFGGGHVIASFADPAGHIWELVAGADQEDP
jgi:catechol 2,3-dioxygenase-like lactoylglutathione lyase family enzyme